MSKHGVRPPPDVVEAAAKNSVEHALYQALQVERQICLIRPVPVILNKKKKKKKKGRKEKREKREIGNQRNRGNGNRKRRTVALYS